MVNLSIAIDQATVNAIGEGLSLLARESVEVQGRETRKMGLSICNSLRAARVCPVAPKRIRPKEYVAGLSPRPPRYVTYRNHRRLPIALHRWRLTRKLGTPDQFSKDHYVYCRLRHGPGGVVVKDLAAEKRELLLVHGGIENRGLARKSWGWAKKAIYSAAPDTADWRASKYNRRDPRRDVTGFFRDYVTGPMKGAELKIDNRLDYIGEIIPDASVNEAIMRGYNKWRHNFEALVARRASA